jgi:hypothetical protein
MFDLNFTQSIQIPQNIDYYYIFSNLIGTTYLELLVFTLGIFFYVVFIWFFYTKLAKRDLFELDLEKYDLPEVKWRRIKKLGSTFSYILKYGILFPIYVIFWFTVLSLLMFLLSEDMAVRSIALVSMSLVSTVRIASYFKEELSHDVAKLLPFVLLAIFLTDPNFFSLDLFIERLNSLPSLGWEIPQFFVFSILLEWILRLSYSLKKRGKRIYRKEINPLEKDVES